jgi:DNA-binding transcriptional ArsR family regulator
MNMTVTTEVLEVKLITLQTLRVISDPVRARMIGLFSNGPTTVHKLAEQLGVPLTRLYYHIHQLEEHGLIQVVDQRPRGGTVEKIYATTARTFLVDRSEFVSEPEEALQQANILIDFVLNETIKALRKSVTDGSVDLQQNQPHSKSLQIRRGLGQISKERAEKLHQRLISVMEEFTAPDEDMDQEKSEYWLALAFFPIRFDTSKE